MEGDADQPPESPASSAMGCVGYNLRACMALRYWLVMQSSSIYQEQSWVKMVLFRLQPMPGREATSSSAGSVVSPSNPRSHYEVTKMCMEAGKRHFGFLANRFRASRLALSRQLLSSDSTPPAEVAICTTSSETSSLWHCPRWGAAMIVIQRFTLRNYSYVPTSILHSSCPTTAPQMCSGTPMHPCAYPTATHPRAALRLPPCRPM